MRRVARMAVVIGASVLLLPACGSNGGGGALPTRDVRMFEFGFDPSTITIPKGGATVRLTNSGKVAHDFTVPQLGIGTRDIPPGGQGELDLDGLKPGTYRVICSLPGHVEAGMVGTLVVSER